MADIDIELRGAGIARDALRKLLNNAVHTQSMLQKIVSHEEQLLRRRFEDEKSPDGSSWKQSLRVRVKGGKTLTDTGKLKNSIGSYADASRAGFGTNVPLYEASHQFGVTIRPVRAPALVFRLATGALIKTQKSVLPKRQFLPEKGDEIDVPEWINIIRESLLNV